MGLIILSYITGFYVKLTILFYLFIISLHLFVESVETEGEQQGEKRIDLIKFYNTIFVKVVRDNALKYSTSNSVS